jgi:hypothetical protein
MVEKIITLAKVLENANELPWEYALYLSPKEKPWHLNSRGAVLNLDNCEEDEEDPIFARQNGLIYTLNISNIQDVVDNAKQQKPDIDIDGLLKAFLYYYNHDAFIEFLYRDDLYQLI